MYKVSVVIPIYNVEEYIVRCAESLFNQTLDDIQFIFVDDASPDKSVSLLEQTLEQFPQRKPHTIILHHSQNMGLPTARATGLAHVKAPYVAHCDSDDYVEPTMYEELYQCATENNSDMVICGWIKHLIDGEEIAMMDKPIPDDSLICNFLYGHFYPSVWPRLTRTDIYRRVQFPKDNYLEDLVQTAQLLTYTSKISFVNDCLYHHIWNFLSITKDMRPDVIGEKFQQCLSNYTLMHDFIVRHHPVKEKDFYLTKRSIRQHFYSFDKLRIIRKQILQAFPNSDILSLFNRRITWRQRISSLLFFLGLHLTVKRVYALINKKTISRKQA